jgi:hypothetical protein
VNRLASYVLGAAGLVVLLVMVFLLYTSWSMQREMSNLPEIENYDPLELILLEEMQKGGGGHLDHADDHEAILNRLRRRSDP